MSVTHSPFPRKRLGCPGKILLRQKWRIAASAFVLAGLDPAIHAFDACNEDVDTRDKPAQDDLARTASTVCLEARISPDSPARKRESRIPGFKFELIEIGVVDLVPAHRVVERARRKWDQPACCVNQDFYNIK
jgi:hypothetical protein